MSDISRRIVKCTKCGKESEQLIVYSVNYLLGDKESNDKLINHKQKCPFCNYEAIDISIKDLNKLTRKELVNRFYGYHSKAKIDNSFLTINYLRKIQESLNNYYYESDTDFIMGGRKKFIYDEIFAILNGNKIVDNPLYFVLGSLEEFMCSQNQIYPEDVDKSKWQNGLIDGNDIKEIRDKNDRYSNKGIICLEEKKYIENIIDEIKKFIKGMDGDDMSLFNNYDINEKNNVPQFVYGIPDNMRKKWEKEKEEKEKTEGTLFKSFKGGYSGPSYYYYINKVEDKYQFRFGYSEDGRRIDNNLEDESLNRIDYQKSDYDAFIKELKEIIKDWKDNYDEPNVIDGTQWNLDLLENDKHYRGTNKFPDNFDEFTNLLKKYFNVDMFMNKINKYNVDAEDNIPYEVYGIPDFIREKRKYDINPEDNVPEKVYGIPNANNYEVKPAKTDIQILYGVKNPPMKKESIRIEIRNALADYVMLLTHDVDSEKYHLAFANLKQLDDKSISDLSTNISKHHYDNFVNKLLPVIKDWQDIYSGNNGISWNIKIEESKSKIISGNGEFPSNWNQLIDLLSEYEILFKQKREIDFEKIKDMKYEKLSFEEAVRNNFKDQFLADEVIKYFKEELKENEIVSKVCFKDLMKYNDILNEFATVVVRKSYDIENPITIHGYTAKQISELNPNFNICGVYTFLKYLRDDFEKAEETIKNGFPNKDVISFTLPNNKLREVSSEEAEKYLKEIENEVDQEMVNRGLLTIDGNKKIPAFGSCHVRWAIEKSILKERYNVDWKTPAEKNPNINYD